MTLDVFQHFFLQNTLMARETPTLHGKCHFKSLFFWNPSLIFGHSGAKGKKKAPDSDKEPVGTVHMHSVFLRGKNLER